MKKRQNSNTIKRFTSKGRDMCPSDEQTLLCMCRIASKLNLSSFIVFRRGVFTLFMLLKLHSARCLLTRDKLKKLQDKIGVLRGQESQQVYQSANLLIKTLSGNNKYIFPRCQLCARAYVRIWKLRSWV